MNEESGYQIFDFDSGVKTWADAARLRTLENLRTRGFTPEQLRHQKTWYVGLEALDNDASGRVGDIAFARPWDAHVPSLPLHGAQVSIVYHGYPKQDLHETDAQHRFRKIRYGAHVDGVLAVGEKRRRFMRERHAYVLGLPLNGCTAAPTVVWKGSHKIMEPAMIQAHQGQEIGTVDVTEVYQQARRKVFETCPVVPLRCKVGQAFLLHPMALHGTAPWGESAPFDEGRMTAFFRPEF